MAGAEGKKRAKRRWWIVLAMPFVLAAAAWFLVERYIIQIDRYRPGLIAEIEDYLGLPASIGSLDLVLLPRPHVNAHLVRVGEGDFQGESERIVIDASLRPLLQRRLEISAITITGAQFRVPAAFADLAHRIERVVDRVREKRRTPPGAFEVSIDRIDMRGAAVFRGDGPGPYLTVGVDARDVLSEEVQVRLSGKADGLGASAAFRGDFSYRPAAAEKSVTGSASMEGVMLARLPIERLEEALPDAIARAEFRFEGNGPDFIGADVSGGVESREHPMVSGKFTGKAWWDHGVFTLNDLTWDAPEVQVTADLTRHEDGRVAAQAASARLSGDALATLVNVLPLEPLRLTQKPDAVVAAQDLLVGWAPGERVRVAHGIVTLSGLDAVTKDGASITRDTRGRVLIVDGAFRIEELTGQGFMLSGVVRPDWETESVFVDVSGHADLEQAKLAVFIPWKEVRDLAGRVTVERAAGTFARGRGIPPDLVAQGVISDGRGRIETQTLRASFERIDAEFKTDARGIDTTARGESPEWGTLSANGRYTFEERTWSGALSGDVERIARTLVDGEDTQRRLESVLAQYGPSNFLLETRLPSADEGEIIVSARRDGEPPLDVDATWVREGEAWVLGPVAAKTRLPLDELDSIRPEGVTALGQANASFARTYTTDGARSVPATFTFFADLTHASVRAGEHLEKRAGDRLTVTVEGPAAEKWTAESLVVEVLGERLPMTVSDGRVYARDLNVDIGKLAGLLPKGSIARGAVTGAFATAPFEADLRLDRVGVKLEKDVEIDSMTGDVAVRDGYFTIRELRVLGADSDCVITAGQETGGWRGAVTGKKLDLDSLAVFAGAASAFASEGRREDAASKPFIGTFTVAVNEAYYRRGRAEQLRATVNARETGLYIEDLSFRPYTGRVSGTVTVTPASGPDRVFQMDLNMDSIEARFIDEIAFAEPREFHGTVTGRLTYRAPWGGPKEMMKRADGRVQWSAADGSFGKLGFATKLLTALRTTEVFQLRLPSLRDQGLVYETCSGTLVLERGVVRFENTALQSPSYSMEATGQIDFARDDTRVTVRVGLLETANRLVRRVPLLRDAVGAATGLARVSVRVSGSPYDPSFLVLP